MGCIVKEEVYWIGLMMKRHEIQALRNGPRCGTAPERHGEGEGVAGVESAANTDRRTSRVLNLEPRTERMAMPRQPSGRIDRRSVSTDVAFTPLGSGLSTRENQLDTV